MIFRTLSSQSIFIALLGLVVFGYPLTSLLTAFVQLNTETFTYTGRIVTFCFGLIALFMPGARVRKGVIFLLIFFFFVYITRLIYDAFFANILGAADALLIFIVMTVVPALGLWSLVPTAINLISIHKGLIIFGLVFLSIYYAAYFSGRFEISFIDEDVGRLNFSRLGPIALGHAGVSCILIGICSLKTREIIWKASSLLLIFSSIPIVLSVGSRGPVLALLLCSFVFLRGFGLRNKIFFIITALLIIFYTFQQSTTFLRVGNLLDFQQDLDLSALARLEYQRLAIQSFISSPLFGEFYIDPSLGKGKYPHNIMIETGMALGLIGLIPLCLILGGLLRITAKSHSRVPVVFVVLGLQYLVNSMLSANLWGGSDKLWLLCGVILLMAERANSPRKLSSGTM